MNLCTRCALLLSLSSILVVAQLLVVMPGVSVPAALGLSANELQIVSLVNGTRVYQYASELENVALSNYAYRSGGSRGVNETARLIAEKFRDLGLETWNESFPFTNWDLLSKPSLTLDEDGNPGTVGDQVNVTSFESDHLSYPAPAGGVFADLVVLPLPIAANRGEIGVRPINSTAWSSINTAGKILLIGKEVTWDSVWYQTFLNKIYSQVPKAVVFTWWYSWMSFTPPMISSGGGRPVFGAYYWNLHVPVGWVNYQDGLLIRNLESSVNISAKFVLDSQISQGTHNNVVAKITGLAEPSKYVIVSGHMDSVMTAGFIDNAAGTGGVVEVARVVSEAIRQGWYYPKYTILFVAFTDEEFGLVGSINYVMRHKTDMPNIVAVINIDCIGSDNFEVSGTNPDPATGLDLDQVALTAAHDIGISANVVSGASDHEPFMNPTWANSYYSNTWGLYAGISGVPPVEPSAIFASAPLMYSDLWNTGQAGWIHTSYDNSTSTATLNWAEPANLANHVKVALLTLLRISTFSGAPDLAVVSLGPSKTVVGQGLNMSITVTVQNHGTATATWNVTVNANSTVVDRKTAPVSAGAVQTLTFTWNTSGYSKGRYQMSAHATTAFNETDTADNNLIDGWITVALTGDVAGQGTFPNTLPDGKVDIKDLAAMAKCYGAVYPNPQYVANYDLDGNGKIEIKDLALAAKNYGKIDP